ncbi:hypothetical protein [uncultured Tateyamaria sp.]|nr:hypothetical protein [uncultured Tateyamaria sp.]
MGATLTETGTDLQPESCGIDLCTQVARDVRFGHSPALVKGRKAGS